MRTADISCKLTTPCPPEHGSVPYEIVAPLGIFFIRGKETPAADRQHVELLARLDELGRQIAMLKSPGEDRRYFL